MGSSDGYWVRVIDPQIEDAVGGIGFWSALDQIIGNDAETKFTKKMHL